MNKCADRFLLLQNIVNLLLPSPSCPRCIDAPPHQVGLTVGPLL